MSLEERQAALRKLKSRTDCSVCKQRGNWAGDFECKGDSTRNPLHARMAQIDSDTDSVVTTTKDEKAFYLGGVRLVSVAMCRHTRALVGGYMQETSRHVLLLNGCCKMCVVGVFAVFHTRL